ncbi:transposase family protein [Streptomyces griseorubiginosus]|uniref:Transposase IS204/IS1001/IS1096/IS1165 zinc-finger domain-containing protein n=1 Tax=Streptomyces griseorubiginosus TaxID=67304 RepID=A0A101RPP8_9ACTN|nr:transposase family protein [Streptomyces griseorubiginosus]KUN59540.1 hypothetical protein AQJ54_39595 [Streptomyces griseorubiginosus]
MDDLGPLPDDVTRYLDVGYDSDETARTCPACGVFATRVKGSATTRLRDLPYGERDPEFRWHKHRWFCGKPDCPRRSFTEQIPQIPARAPIITRLRTWAARRVRDAGSTVVQPPATCTCPGRPCSPPEAVD